MMPRFCTFDVPPARSSRGGQNLAIHQSPGSEMITLALMARALDVALVAARRWARVLSTCFGVAAVRVPGGYAISARPGNPLPRDLTKSICSRRREMSITRHYTARIGSPCSCNCAKRFFSDRSVPPLRRHAAGCRAACHRVAMPPCRLQTRAAPTCNDTLQAAESHVIALRCHAAGCRLALLPPATTRCRLQSCMSSRCDATLPAAELHVITLRCHAAGCRAARHRVAMPPCRLQICAVTR
jgi:hypothetical protein